MKLHPEIMDKARQEFLDVNKYEDISFDVYKHKLMEKERDKDDY